jgi:hypothetical protein
MDVRVVSLRDPSRLLRTLRRMFPDADVGVQPGVDVRDVDVRALFGAGLVAHTAAHTLRHGRKWHHEHSSKGGIGLIHAVRLALARDTTRPLLLLEDDCVFRDEAAVVRDVATMRAHADAFDVATFGAQRVSSTSSLAPVAFLSDGWYHVGDDPFYLLHCVFYTPRARRVLAEYLARPSEMQLDGLYSSLAALGELRVLMQLAHRSAVQAKHASSIQEVGGGCAFCHVTRGPAVETAVLWTAVCLLVVAAAAYTAGRCRP